MTDLRTAAQQALEALDEATNYTSCPTWSPSMTEECKAAVAALRAALAEPVQWVGCGDCDNSFPCHKGQSQCIRLPAHAHDREMWHKQPLYTARNPLTEEEIYSIGAESHEDVAFARAVERAHGIE